MVRDANRRTGVAFLLRCRWREWPPQPSVSRIAFAASRAAENGDVADSSGDGACPHLPNSHVERRERALSIFLLAIMPYPNREWQDIISHKESNQPLVHSGTVRVALHSSPSSRPAAQDSHARVVFTLQGKTHHELHSKPSLGQNESTALTAMQCTTSNGNGHWQKARCLGRLKAPWTQHTQAVIATSIGSASLA
uniref:Uncharacterized protein n=1 Tax=Oryza sativa subsp. japonica TaxID=39947 RepID=Q10SF0_ORYSJ|nr:hypothetical protein LOC_Os03g03340 [Oryza sativa Japonica Group]